MLIDQVRKRNNSWAIRWYASIFLQDKLALHVGKSLVLNIGNDNSGTHGGKTDSYNVSLNVQQIKVHEIETTENKAIRKEIAVFLDSTKQSFLRLFFNRVINTLRAVLGL
jgi:hypothetical protein